MDYSSQIGAKVLGQRIEEYWAERGLYVWTEIHIAAQLRNGVDNPRSIWSTTDNLRIRRCPNGYWRMEAV